MNIYYFILKNSNSCPFVSGLGNSDLASTQKKYGSSGVSSDFCTNDCVNNGLLEGRTIDNHSSGSAESGKDKSKYFFPCYGDGMNETTKESYEENVETEKEGSYNDNITNTKIEDTVTSNHTSSEEDSEQTYCLEVYEPSLKNVENESYHDMKTKNADENKKNLDKEKKSNGLFVDVSFSWLNCSDSFSLKSVANKNEIKFSWKKNSRKNVNINKEVKEDTDTLEFGLQYNNIITCLMEIVDEKNDVCDNNGKSKMVIYFILKEIPKRDNNNIVDINSIFQELGIKLKERSKAEPYVMKIVSETKYHVNVYHFEYFLWKAVCFENRRRNVSSHFLSYDDFRHIYKNVKCSSDKYNLTSPFIRIANKNIPFNCYRRYVDDESMFFTVEQADEVIESLSCGY